MVLCDVTSAVTEFMVIGLQRCGMVHARTGTGKRVDAREACHRNQEAETIGQVA
jgi:hypothetical protein